VGELLIESRFSLGDFSQGLLQRTGVRKRDHGIGRMSVSTKIGTVVARDAIERRRISQVDVKKKLGVRPTRYAIG